LWMTEWEASLVDVDDDMNENERFEEVEKDVKLRLTELKEYLQSIKDTNSGASLTAAKQCLKEVDQHVPFQYDNNSQTD
jgi:hypothetical protein